MSDDSVASQLRDDELGKARRAGDPSYACNGCHGEGKSLKWPTDWKSHRGDIIPVSEVADSLQADTLVVGKKVLDFITENPVNNDFDGNVKKALKKLGVKDGYLVAVDYRWWLGVRRVRWLMARKWRSP